MAARSDECASWRGPGAHADPARPPWRAPARQPAWKGWPGRWKTKAHSAETAADAAARAPLVPAASAPPSAPIARASAIRPKPARGAGGRGGGRASAAKDDGAPPPARMRTKHSYGVIVTRINPATRRPEAVLVRGRYSYEFGEFVHGRYSRGYLRGVAALIDGMSVNERLDLLSLNFAQMWYRVWLTADRRDLYNQKFAKFQAAWMRDDCGETLRRLVRESRPSPCDRGLHLEFPKGRPQTEYEPDLNCAIRETEEETRIAKRDYQLFPGFRRQVAYTHMGVRYVNVYYAGVARRDFDVRVAFGDLEQVSEIAEVHWMDIEQIRLNDTPERRLEATVAPVFRFLKRYVRGAGGRPPLAGHRSPRRPRRHKKTAGAGDRGAADCGAADRATASAAWAAAAADP
jgi:8-oxo-dGTP pyrophosphatase MutT (NUDIX family)